MQLGVEDCECACEWTDKHWLPTGTLLRLKCLAIPRVFGPTAENDVKNYLAGVC
jgi:hypothetical protein